LRTIRLGFELSSVIPPRRRPSATSMSFAFSEWVVHHSMGSEEVRSDWPCSIDKKIVRNMIFMKGQQLLMLAFFGRTPILDRKAQSVCDDQGSSRTMAIPHGSCTGRYP